MEFKAHFDVILTLKAYFPRGDEGDVFSNASGGVEIFEARIRGHKLPNPAYFFTEEELNELKRLAWKAKKDAEK